MHENVNYEFRAWTALNVNRRAARTNLRRIHGFGSWANISDIFDVAASILRSILRSSSLRSPSRLVQTPHHAGILGVSIVCFSFGRRGWPFVFQSERAGYGECRL